LQSRKRVRRMHAATGEGVSGLLAGDRGHSKKSTSYRGMAKRGPDLKNVQEKDSASVRSGGEKNGHLTRGGMDFQRGKKVSPPGPG